MPDKMTKVDNKPAKHPGGRPLKFPDPVAFDNMIDAFFVDCRDNGYKPTIERLACYMDTNRETLDDYANKPEFSDSVKRAKRRCLAWLIENGLDARNPAMQIFLAKNNYGYRDKTEVETTVNVINYADRLAVAEERRRLQEHTIDAEIVHE